MARPARRDKPTVRVGIFGGTFDPIHWGHLLVAECCREECKLDQVWFVPSAQPPHKLLQPISEPKHRLNMLHLATDGHESFVVNPWELDQPGPSFTYRTLEHFRREHPEHEFFLLLGADSVAEFPTWKHPERICRLAHLVAVPRPRCPEVNWDPVRRLVDEATWQWCSPRVVEMPLVGISSREIRRRLAQGRSIRYQVPAPVEMYIYQHGLYQAADSQGAGN